ncbi:ATP-binding protein [Streptomyces ovatisporus]|uniref:ATP-binding protein n=1 Tax=Streptomyces ovatisporus TaxID=1128682 RepID=A0ABV9A251_9ACTN
MAGERAQRLYGRDPLLRSLMPQLTGLAYGERARVRWEPRASPPVVLVAGQHGMGRSAVLEALASGYSGRLPFAYVRAVQPDQRPAVPQQDEEPRTAATFVELLQELVCGLAPGLPTRYPLRRSGTRHPFRTLLPGLIAVSGWQPGDADERDETCLRIARMLTACGLGGQDVKRLRRTWAEHVDPAGRAAGRGDEPGERGAAFEQLTRDLVDRFAQMCPIGPAQAWYAEQYGEAATGDGEGPSPLVRLGLRLHQGGDPGRASERTLVAALLHDIAAAYGPLQRANRERWPLILLDDAHHRAGRRFVDLLLEQRARGEQPHEDRLVLAATHLGGTPEEAPDAMRCELPLLADALKKPEPPQRGRSPSAGMLVVPLTPLNRDEILSLLDRADATLHPYLASAVYALTDGHPAASTIMCDAVLAAARRNEKVTPDSLLELTDGDGRPVTSVILEQLLPQQRQRQRLVQLCLARDRTAAEALAGHLGMQGPEQSPVSAAEDYLEAHRWQRYTTPDGPLVAHPMLQRLLTAEARRTMHKEGGALWGDVHDFLCDHHVRSGDEGGKFNRGRAHWHSMAAGDVDKAIGVLRDLFASWNPGDAREWLKLLAHLGTAPVPPYGGAADSLRRIALGEDDSAGKDPGLNDEAEWSINRLLHAVWCLSEPHTEPDPDLCAVLREEFGCLSRLHQTWRTELRHVARGWPSDAERKRPFTVPGENSE